jgi:hypothetical protein
MSLNFKDQLIRVVFLLFVLAVLQASQYIGIVYRNFWAPLFDVYTQAVARAVVALTGASSQPLRREPHVSDVLLNGNVAVAWNQMHWELWVSLLAFAAFFRGTRKRKMVYFGVVTLCFYVLNVAWYAWCVKFPNAGQYFVYDTTLPPWAAIVTGVMQGIPFAATLALAGGWLLWNRPRT